MNRGLRQWDTDLNATEIDFVAGAYACGVRWQHFMCRYSMSVVVVARNLRSGSTVDPLRHSQSLHPFLSQRIGVHT